THGVGLETGAIVDVDDLHLLVLEDVGRLHEEGVDRDRALVLEVGAGHGRPVNLGLAPHTLHDSPAQFRIKLSISRVSPTKPATAMTSPGRAFCTASRDSGSTSSTYWTRTPAPAITSRTIW